MSKALVSIQIGLALFCTIVAAPMDSGGDVLIALSAAINLSLAVHAIIKEIHRNHRLD